MAGSAEAGRAAQPQQGAVGATEAEAVRLAGGMLLDALEGHIPGARAGADAVATYAFATAVELGESRARCELVREVARLHEVGKVYLPSHLVRRPPEELLPGERAALEAHREHGRALLVGAGVSAEVAELVLHTGERFDGRGPSGLSGRAIPLPSRIIRAARIYHQGASSSGGGLWRGEPRELGVGRIRGLAGSELDPDVVRALTQILTRAASRSGG